MTRFARASGSKASNQRVPEDSTPWFELKHQATVKKNAEETHENETDWKSVIDSEKKIKENKNSVWCEFEEDKPKDRISNNVRKRNKIDSKKLGKHKSEGNELVSSSLGIKGKKKSKLCENFNSANDDVKSDLKNIKSKLKLSNNKSVFQVEEYSEVKTEESSVRNGNKDSESAEIITSKKKKKQKRKFSDQQDINQLQFLENQSPGPNEIEEINQIPAADEKEEYSGSKLSVNNEKNQKSMKRNKTITWQKHGQKEAPFKRRKLDKGDEKLEINGQEIWVTRLDGFYIKKEDAERIRQLEKDLLKRGVSKQEVRATIKKERRNAEKSLARQKKKVCFHCRKGGHTLSSCPMLEDNGAQIVGSGICYKCGSTEHTHYQCKVNTGDSYKFATCFVCKQEGHISKQCPDNPRGLYPSGGSCKLCGDVTHFRRDCPTLQKKSNNNKVTVGLIDQDIEALDGQSSVPTSKEPASKRKNKIIKFS